MCDVKVSMSHPMTSQKELFCEHQAQWIVLAASTVLHCYYVLGFIKMTFYRLRTLLLCFKKLFYLFQDRLDNRINA